MQALSGVQQPLVKSVVVINHEGKRICSRFCDRVTWPDEETRRAFEMSLLRKVQSMGESNASLVDGGIDVMEFMNYVVAFKHCDDLFMFVIGGINENELVMVEVLQALDDTLNTIMRGQVFEEAVLENLESLLLVVDELVDQEGIIMELEPEELAARVGQQGGSFIDQVPLGEQTLGQALQTARDQITRSILS